MSKLSEHFMGIAAKVLTATEVDLNTSHGHEFQGVHQLRSLLGACTEEKRNYSANFMYLGGNEDDFVRADGALTWYDCRARNPNRSAECRFYVKDNPVYALAEAGDLLVIGKPSQGPLLVLVVLGGGTYERQIRRLFGLDSGLNTLTVRETIGQDDLDVGFAEQKILQELGFEPIDPNEGILEDLLSTFPTGFPNTKDFSDYSRDLAPRVSALEDPDVALIEWVRHEEMLFRVLEKHFLLQKLESGFHSTEEFIEYSISIHNRRKSRAGHALENHLEEILTANDVRFSRNQKTENRARPDFMFPGIDSYRDPNFPVTLLSMLGVKSTCKDRWRQVLSEAARIPQKHLLTLERGISVNQTEEMNSNNLRLVVPQGLHWTYTSAQQDWMLCVKDFIVYIRSKQE